MPILLAGSWSLVGRQRRANLRSKENIVPVMPGIRSGSSVNKDTIYSRLSGQWSPQAEQKTGVTIKNQTASKLRLITSDPSGARFDPPAPKEIAPGDTVVFATFSKDASNPKLSYEVLPKEGATQGATKSPVWTLSWQTRWRKAEARQFRHGPGHSGLHGLGVRPGGQRRRVL